MKKITVTCPNCKKNFDYYSSTFRPFCSERCRLVDLGQWLDEGYRVPVKNTQNEDDEIEEKIKQKDENDEE